MHKNTEGRPSREELEYFIERLVTMECEKPCNECIMFYSGFCKEAEHLLFRIIEARENEGDNDGSTI